MRFLVVGAGATGGYFGARLAQAGRDVTFLVRPARAAQLRSDGLRLVTPNGDARLEPALVASARLRPDYDVIILAVKAYALESALDDLAPAVGDRAAILPFLNGMRHIDVLVERFGERPVLGGVCLVSTQLDDAGRIVQLSAMQELAYGERDGATSARLEALDAALQGAGFTARAVPDIMAQMWAKWVALAALGGITCLLRGNVGDIEAVSGGAGLAVALLDECAAIAAAAGVPISAAVRERTRALLTAPGSPLASSMYRDLQQGRPVEADQIVGDLLDRGRRCGIAAPLLSAAFASLEIYAARLARTADAAPVGA